MDQAERAKAGDQKQPEQGEKLSHCQAHQVQVKLTNLERLSAVQLEVSELLKHKVYIELEYCG